MKSLFVHLVSSILEYLEINLQTIRRKFSIFLLRVHGKNWKLFDDKNTKKFIKKAIDSSGKMVSQKFYLFDFLNSFSISLKRHLNYLYFIG